MATMKLIRGVVLVAVSVLLSIATLGLWLGNLQTNPVLSWVVFLLGFGLCAVAAIAGIWGILGAFKDKEEK